MLGMRRNSSSSRRAWSRVSSRNSSGVATGGYLRQLPLSLSCGGRTFSLPLWGRAGWGLVDKAQEFQARRGLEGAVVHPAPAAVVHLRHRERTIGVHRLDVRYVADRRRPADALNHDGANHWQLALGKAELLRVVPPLPGVTGPRDVALVRNPPGAVPVRELSAGAVYRGVAVGDRVVGHLPTQAVPGHRFHRLLADPARVERRSDTVRQHQHGAGLEACRITDQVEVDDVLDVDVVLDGQ